jgi:hypothetical protein
MFLSVSDHSLAKFPRENGVLSNLKVNLPMTDFSGCEFAHAELKCDQIGSEPLIDRYRHSD